MAIAKEAFNSARTHLNDSESAVWSDSTLLPHLKEAHRDLQVTLWLNGLPVIRKKSATINVNASALDLGSNQPIDLVSPISLKERAQGSSEGWTDVTETDFEPDRQMASILDVWCWREERIKFVGSTSNREVLLRYHAGMTLPKDENSVLGFIFAEYFLGPQTAQYAARSVGGTSLANECLEEAKQKLDMVIRANIKGQQNLPVRRIPYRRAVRGRLIL